MSTPTHSTTAPPTRTAQRTGRAVRAALVLAVLLALGDLAAGAATVGSDPAGTTIGVFGAVVAVITIAALPAAWRGRESALRAVAATRLLGALTAVPAFFVADVAAGLVIAAAVTVACAVLVTVVVLRPARSRA